MDHLEHLLNRKQSDFYGIGRQFHHVHYVKANSLQQVELLDGALSYALSRFQASPSFFLLVLNIF